MRIVLYLLLGYSIAACSARKSTQKKLAGKWRPVSFQSSQVSEKESRDIIENARIELSADLKFRSYLGKEMQDEGSFTFDEKSQKLTVSNRSENQVYTVRWAGDTLILDNSLQESMRLVKE